ncbi:MAG: hypothetical protein AB7I59_06195 [Geminicoccaceae bacterium]
MTLSLNVVGLLYDIAGAVTLGLSYAVTADRDMLRWTEVSLDAPGTRVAAERRLDAKIGVSYLVVGFLLQMLSSLGMILELFWELLIILTGTLALMLFAICRKRLVESAVARIEAERTKLQRTNSLPKS